MADADRLLLNEWIQQGLTVSQRRLVCNHLWPMAASSLDRTHEAYYFEFYHKICLENSRIVSVKTHQDICDLLDVLRLLDKSWTSLMQDVRYIRVCEGPWDVQEVEAHVHGASLRLVVQLKSMINLDWRLISAADRSLSVPEDSIAKILSQALPQPSSVEPVRLERYFNLAVLEKSSGITIFWTDELQDHLLLDHDDSRVHIFHHAFFLKSQLAFDLDQKNSGVSRPPLYPEGFIPETIETLALLLPQQDAKVQKWFKAKCIKCRLDDSAISCGDIALMRRNTSNYPYWGERLTILKAAFDDSAHQTLLQRLFDSERGNRAWYETWTGFLALTVGIIYGLIQCIEGALQVYKAYFPTT